MGTGPFTIESHQPGVRTVFKKNPNYWGKMEGNVDEIIFTPIANDSTRVSALLSGEVLDGSTVVVDLAETGDSLSLSPAGTA